MDAELLFHPSKWIKVNDSCQIISDLDLQFAEQQYDRKRKGHLNVTLINVRCWPSDLSEEEWSVKNLQAIMVTTMSTTKRTTFLP